MLQVQYPNLLQDTPQYDQPQLPEIIEDDCIAAQKLNEQQHQIQVVYNAIPVDQQEDQLQHDSYVSDLPFRIQKNFLIDILGLQLAWSSIHLSVIYIYLLYFDYQPDPDSDLQIYESLIPCGCIMMILFNIAGLQKIYRQFSVYFLMGLIFAYCLAFCSFYQLMNQQFGLLFFRKIFIQFHQQELIKALFKCVRYFLVFFKNPISKKQKFHNLFINYFPEYLNKNVQAFKKCQ